MQQPPHGRPLPGQQPQRPPAYVPPQQQPQQRQPYPQQPPQQYQPPYQPPAQQQPTPLPPPTRPKKSRGSLRFLAATCVFSGWVTLVLSIVMAIGTFMAGASAAAMLGAASRSQQYFPATPSSPSMPGMPSPMDPSGGLLGGEGGLSSNPLGGGGGPFTGMATLFQKSIPALSFAGGVFTLVTGIVSFLLFLGLGQVCYVLLDLEEQQGRMENMLQVLTLRPGGR